MRTSRSRTHAREQSSLYGLSSRRKLAALLGISMGKLKELAGPAHLYSQFPITKKDGSHRLVDNPRDDLKAVQKRLSVLLGRIAPPDFLFCPAKGRSYVANAAQHRGHRVVHSLDVKKYFPSTSRKRVYWFFHSVMNCATDVAAVLARLACCGEYLPTGSPLSPIMAYCAHVDVWENLAEIAQAHGLTITIYIDDVTVSGSRVPTWVMWEIKRAIDAAGLSYHKEKRAVDRPSEITGVVHREGELDIPNRQRQKLRYLRSELDRNRGNPANTKLAGRLAGLQGQVAQVRGANKGRLDPA